MKTDVGKSLKTIQSQHPRANKTSLEKSRVYLNKKEYSTQKIKICKNFANWFLIVCVEYILRIELNFCVRVCVCVLKCVSSFSVYLGLLLYPKEYETLSSTHYLFRKYLVCSFVYPSIYEKWWQTIPFPNTCVKKRKRHQ